MTVTDGNPRPGASPIALAAMAIGAAAAAILLAARALRVWRDGVGTIDRAVELVIELGATACAGWLAIGAAIGMLYAVARRTGRDWHAGRAFLARCAPRLVRRMAGVAVTAGVGIGIAAPGAFAAPVFPSEPDDAPSAGVVLDLGWQPTGDAVPAGLVGSDLGPVAAGSAGLAGPGSLLPGPGTAGTDRPGEPRARDPERIRQADRKARGGARRDDRAPVVVRAGDTLWAIATERLGRAGSGPGTGPPDPGRVARAVVGWHDANREAIGPDPDIIQPGTVLRPPDARTLGGQP